MKNEFIVGADGKDCSFDENLVHEASQESLDEVGFSSDAFSSSDDDGVMSESESARTDLQTGNHDDVASSDIPNHECISSRANGENDAAEMDAMLQFTAKSKKLVQDGYDELGAFNPRAPNFLVPEADPEAQKVDLKHQELDERKNAEEWMVDYALRQVVTKLSPARKRKVSLLVEAFVKVMGS